MSTNIEFLHADQIGGCVTLISTDTTKICGTVSSFAQISSDILAEV